jgi:hypothetical protein
MTQEEINKKIKEVYDTISYNAAMDIRLTSDNMTKIRAASIEATGRIVAAMIYKNA